MQTQALQQAESLFRSGDVGRAETLCAELIGRHPEDQRARRLFAEIALAWEGRADEAAAVLAELDLGADGGAGWPLLAEALVRLGRLDEARGLRGKAECGWIADVIARIDAGPVEAPPAAGDPDGRAAWLTGRALNAAGRHDEAAPLLEAAAGRAGPPALVSLLAAQVGMNAFDGARAVCQRLMRAGLALSPAERAFHNAVLVSVLRPLADIQPDDIRTRALLAIVLLDDARAVSEAQGLLDAAYRSGAEDAYLSLAYGILFFKIGDMARAAGYLAPGGAGDPCAEDRAYWARLAEAGAGDDWRAPEALAAFAAHELYHLGEALARGRRPAAAADALSEVVARAPHWIDVYPTLATLLGMLGRSVEALDHCRRADALFPNDPGILWEISHCHLALGDLAAGWRQAENRLKVWQSHSEARHRGVPKWSGEDLTGKTVVVWREEGIGDEIRLSSCLPEFRNRTGATVVWECSPRLAGLYARSLDGIAVVAEAPDNGVYDAADFHLPVGDLPLHYRESLEAFPETGRFLEADPDLAAVWRTRLDGLGAGPKIGVGWRSLNNSWIKAPMSSSATDWRAVFAIPGAQFVNLQCDADAGEIERIRERFGAPFHAFGDLDLKDDLEGVAALIDGLDLVISCRCWLIHLAGALGREVLTFSAPPNALMMGLAYNPWAPETEVFYGAVDEPWEPVLNEMASRACGLLDL